MTQMIFSGTAFNGVGEGAKYVKIYEKEIEKIGFRPFYGTLNIKIDPTKRNELLKQLKCTKIDGFSKNGKRYGEIKCYEAFDEKGDKLLIIVPEITRYKDDVLEIVSNDNLREKFNLRENDIFNIHLKNMNKNE